MIATNDKNRAAAPGRGNDAARTGLTTLEFVACTVAVIGGVWLGALYLGVDVRHMAHTALEEAELLDKVPPKWRPPAPDDKAMTREQLVATLREELGALRHELAALHSGASDADAAGTARPIAGRAIEPGAATSTQGSKDKTLAYWQRISDIALHEAALQRDAELASNEQNAAKVFAIKARISRFAAKSVDTVPSDGVENAMLQFGRQLAKWYEGGGELYDRAVRIWESAADGQSREKLNQEWRRAELHHRNAAHLLNEKANGVRSAAGRQFGVEFPEFAKPVAAAAGAGTNVQ